MAKVDFKKIRSALYRPSSAAFSLIDVPPMMFLMIDGAGDPNVEPAYAQAISWLFSMAYALKFSARANLRKDYVVPPLEGLWDADDPADFVARRKNRWRWTMMIMTPDFVRPEMFAQALEKTRAKFGDPPRSLRLERFSEGPSLQILHIGPYDDEGPTLARLHNDEMPARGLTFNGRHHEIYLSDARRTLPNKLKTILRQPVRDR